MRKKSLRELPSRLVPRAAASARMIGHLGKAAAKRIVRRSDEDSAALGESLFEELDRMKGIAMKVGQILSYMDVGLPEATIQRLAKLQQGTQPLDLDVIQAELEAQLGQPMQALFERFDPDPIAAASIGQVHRARADGREVAVKIRYPSVRETLHADFQQLEVLGRLASLGTQVDGMALVNELHQRMLDECDYGLEARSQAAFSAIFADDPDIVIPEVLPHLSAEGVLTTAFCTGTDFATAETAPPARRAALSQTLIRFPYQSVLGHGLLQADPHPGNFLFAEEGRIVALDFGCVKAFPAAEVEAFRTLSRMVITSNRRAFREAVIATGQAPRPDRIDWDEMWALQRWLHAPFLTSHFHFTRRWWLKGMHFNRPTAPNQRHLGLPPDWLWLLRMQWGLNAVLIRLHAEGDFRAVFEACLDLPLQPREDDGPRLP